MAWQQQTWFPPDVADIYFDSEDTYYLMDDMAAWNFAITRLAAWIFIDSIHISYVI